MLGCANASAGASASASASASCLIDIASLPYHSPLDAPKRKIAEKLRTKAPPLLAVELFF